jgi:hypothetical protein
MLNIILGCLFLIIGILFLRYAYKRKIETYIDIKAWGIGIGCLVFGIPWLIKSVLDLIN